MVSWEFFSDVTFRPHYGPGVDINEYKEYFLGINAAGAYG